MTRLLKITFIAAMALGATAFAGAASARPGEGLQAALATSQDVATEVENVRLICPPYRPCFYAPGFYRPYGYERPYGFRRYGYRPFYRRHFFY